MVETHDVWNALHDRFGDDLRAVIRYDGEDMESLKRDDVRERSTPLDDREIVDGIIIRHLNFADNAPRFRAGSLDAIVRVFEDAHVISRPDSLARKSGFVVSIDRDCSVPVEQVVELLEEVLEDDAE